MLLAAAALRVAEFRTEEKVGAKGEAATALAEGLIGSGLGAEASLVEPTLVLRGVRPRRLLGWADSPQADCRGLPDPALDGLESLEVMEFCEEG